MSWLARFFRRTAPPVVNISAMKITPERLASLRESDQFIVSFPRSGNTWTRHLLYEVILQQHPELPAPGDAFALLPTMHKNDADDPAMEKFGLKTRILKSHNIRDIAGRRMVYLFRMPGDSLVSFFHHCKRNAKKRGLAFDQTIEDFCRQTVPEWCEHMELGLKQAAEFPTRTLLLAYETLHRNTPGSLRGVLDFLGLAASEEEMARAVERASLNRQQPNEANRTGTAGGANGLSKGRVGSSIDELSPEVLAEIDRVARPLYERAFAASFQTGG
jgi:hypothetical protein